MCDGVRRLRAVRFYSSCYDGGCDTNVGQLKVFGTDNSMGVARSTVQSSPTDAARAASCRRGRAEARDRHIGSAGDDDQFCLVRADEQDTGCWSWS